MERMVQAKTKFTLKESQIFLRIMTTYESNEDAIVYDDNVITVTKRELCSLLPCTLIEVGVISAWASYLNNMEGYMALSSSRRLFFTTYTSLYTIVDRPYGVDLMTLFDRFCDNLQTEVEQIPYFKWDDVDLVFFPICAVEHYYTICFRFSTKSIVVIDNSKNADDEDVLIKYGGIPGNARLFFCHFLTKMGYHNQSKSIKYASIVRLKMPWRTTFGTCGSWWRRAC
ncbi:uncharacterized protein LOC121763036 [Salvia splendens]|uniref:uncharacterized protein LOC121763036 n=1 Tax=Salvia splendens TaxID=180675 RepID=UPI001C259C85|nr:uncharacterized protein LOC121763036 [Salvia splendens]